MQRYLITFVVFLVIDMVWLLELAPKLYQAQIGFLLADQPNLLAAVLFYLLFIFGLLIFVINPALEKKKGKCALGKGIIFGLITYATYDLTNLATIEGWPILITVIDLLWGSFIAGTTAITSFFIISKIEKK